jgi:glutamine amidotransferase
VITVVDYGSGNIGSVLNMIRKAGGQATATSNPADLRCAEKILLPGVGSFDNAMSRLNSLRLIEPLQACAGEGVPLLGICLGMQLLADSSEEGQLPGLGLVPGHVRRFRFGNGLPALKVPHMGWNRIMPTRTAQLTRGLEMDARFYFVHSYWFDCADPADVMLRTVYGFSFPSGVQRVNVTGVQFHPEKSHRFGMQLLKNFVEM